MPLPWLAVGNGLKPEWTSRDPAVVKAYDDPLVHNRVTARLVRFLHDSGGLRATEPRRGRCRPSFSGPAPTACVAPAGSAAFAGAAPEDVVRSKEYPGCFHEILNEPEQAEALDEIRRWLSEQGS